MSKITIKEAAGRMEISEQCLRMMIKAGKIPGAIMSGSKARKSYYLTDAIIENAIQGRLNT